MSRYLQNGDLIFEVTDTIAQVRGERVYYSLKPDAKFKLTTVPIDLQPIKDALKGILYNVPEEEVFNQAHWLTIIDDHWGERRPFPYTLSAVLFVKDGRSIVPSLEDMLGGNIYAFVRDEFKQYRDKNAPKITIVSVYKVRLRGGSSLSELGFLGTIYQPPEGYAHITGEITWYE